MKLFLIAGGLAVMLPLLRGQDAGNAQQNNFFETRIRPILANQCFACHTTLRLGGLVLQSRDDLLRGGVSGPAVVPGDPDKSLLIQAVRQQGDLKMPKGGKLSNAEIEDLTRWIKDGAVWPSGALAQQTSALGKAGEYRITPEQRDFWSFRPIQPVKAPAVKNTTWPLNDIDRFVLARLEKEGMKPATNADRRTLLRRLTYDLTGLMPTYAEVKAFENDKSPQAYEKIVDGLLASRLYGERWGRLWLDVVRYSEDDYNIGSKTGRTEFYPYAFEFRDWVIQALNDGMPYDTFVKAQLAADLMDEKFRARNIPALGMNGLGVWQRAGDPPEVERANEWNDKIDVTTKAFLGLTVACARCHDHKYDPIPQKDYYRLASVFLSSQFKAYPLVDQKVADDYDNRKTVIAEKEKDLQKFIDDAAELHSRTLFARTEDYMLAVWRVGSDIKGNAEDIAREKGLDPDVLRRWIRFLKKPPNNYSYLKPWQEMIARGGSEEEAKKLASDFHNSAVQVVAMRDKIMQENAAITASNAAAKEAFDVLPNGAKRLLTKYGTALKGLDREPMYLWRDLFQEDLPDFPLGVDAMVIDKLPPGVLVFRGEELERRLPPEWQAHIKFLREDIDAAKKSSPAPYAFAYGIAEKSEPENVKVHLRGSPYMLGDPAPRGFLSVLSKDGTQEFTKGSGRLELADAIVAQPLMKRVIVNRIWRWTMGSGLVNTLNNFGAVGERPSNPELLEYLTAQFVDGGMSWKRLIKEIVMSRTYQMSSVVPGADGKENEEKDSDNRLYWRANRRRLESEGLWDLLLSAAGALDLSKQGGPSAHLTDDMHYRGVFGSVSRMSPDVFQQVWDFPVATLSSEGRYPTNVPPQRLFFLNSSVIYKRASDLAARVSHDATLDEQIREVYELVYQRHPTPTEKATIERLLQQPLADLGLPGLKQSETSGAESAAPLNVLCWAVLSSNEFLYLD